MTNHGNLPGIAIASTFISALVVITQINCLFFQWLAGIVLLDFYHV
jgi:hypothetical protein